MDIRKGALIFIMFILFMLTVWVLLDQSGHLPEDTGWKGKMDHRNHK